MPFLWVGDAAIDNSSTLLPNPLTPLAFLPPDVANQVENTRYILDAVVGAWSWDLLMSLPQEWRMFRRHRLTIVGVVYILARCTSLAFIFQSLLFIIGPVNDCSKLVTSLGWCFAFAMPLNSLLFFFRVRAVFNQSHKIIFFFALLWLSTLGCISAPFSIQGAVGIGATSGSSFCIETTVKSFSSAGVIIVTVHDTLVYLAIGLKLTLDNIGLETTGGSGSGEKRGEVTWKDYGRVFFSGRGMGQISRTLLTSGQLYYLGTVGMNIISIAIMVAPSIPPIYKATPSIPNIALQNAMACRVHRLLKLGLINEDYSLPNFFVSGDGPRHERRKVTSIKFRMSSEERATLDTTRTTGHVDPGISKIVSSVGEEIEKVGPELSRC